MRELRCTCPCVPCAYASSEVRISSWAPGPLSPHPRCLQASCSVLGSVPKRWEDKDAIGSLIQSIHSSWEYGGHNIYSVSKSRCPWHSRQVGTNSWRAWNVVNLKEHAKSLSVKFCIQVPLCMKQAGSYLLCLEKQGLIFNHELFQYFKSMLVSFVDEFCALGTVYLSWFFFLI